MKKQRLARERKVLQVKFFSFYFLFLRSSWDSVFPFHLPILFSSPSLSQMKFVRISVPWLIRTKFSQCLAKTGTAGIRRMSAEASRPVLQ